MSNLSLKRIAAVLLSFLIIFSQTVVFSDTVIEETEISNSIYTEKADSENDELYEGFLDKLFYGEEVSFFGTLAGEKLSEIPKALYDVLKKDIEGVCYTETENEALSTVFEVDLNILPSCWGFSFALGCGVSPQSPSSGVQPLLQCHVASTQVPTVFLGLFCPWMWGISSQSLQCCITAIPALSSRRGVSAPSPLQCIAAALQHRAAGVGYLSQSIQHGASKVQCC